MATRPPTTDDIRSGETAALPRLPSLAGMSLFRRSAFARDLASDGVALLAAALDVWLVIPEKAQPYSIALSAVACAAMVFRRRFPFLAVLVTVPGFMAGWSQLAAMVALGTLARRRLWVWQTMAGAGLVWLCRYFTWPLEDFLGQNWREHALNAIYGVIVAGMPVAIGLLFSLHNQLSDRIGELAESRERERRLHEETVRAAERANLAREMHDVVSHQVTLIAMQAGALVVSAKDEDSRAAARTIRQLSTRTLDELRDLVSVLRSGAADDSQPGLDALDELLKGCDGSVVLATRDVPPRLAAPISRAAYRTVQEALTNVRKHADGAKAEVRLQAENGSLVVEVRNEPAGGTDGASASTTALSTEPLPSGGHGLLGLRERAGMLDGTFEAGHTQDGGFLVRASYPLALSSATGGAGSHIDGHGNLNGHGN